MSFNPPSQLPQTNQAKYKTMLCKHFSSEKGCSFGDKCQFAHGIRELRPQGGSLNQAIPEKRKGPNPQNYKIVKCKYWEKDGTCRYGTLCTFAHGDAELRSKTDNIAFAQNEQMNSPMYSMIQNPFMMGFEPNIMPNINLMNYPNHHMMNNMFLNMNNVNNMNNMGMNLDMNNVMGNQIEEKKEEKENLDN